MNLVRKKNIKIKYSFVERKDIQTKKRVFQELSSIIINSWGKFSNSFLINKVFDADKVLIAYAGSEIIAFSQYKKLIDKKTGESYYTIGLSAVKKSWQTIGLNTKMNSKIILRAFIENFFHTGNLKLDLFFTTSNIKFIITLAKVAHKIYPNPFLFDLKRNKLPLADSETWRKSKEFARYIGERVYRLQREGLVIVNSYDDMPWLTPDKNELFFVSSEPVKGFMKRYLGHRETGVNEVIVRTIITPFTFIKFYFNHK